MEPQREVCKVLNFKEIFLKSNQMLLAYGLTSNKYQTFLHKSCFVFLLFQALCLFYAIFRLFVEHGHVATGNPLHLPLNVMALCPLVKYVYVYTYRI